MGEHLAHGSLDFLRQPKFGCVGLPGGCSVNGLQLANDSPAQSLLAASQGNRLTTSQIAAVSVARSSSLIT